MNSSPNMTGGFGTTSLHRKFAAPAKDAVLIVVVVLIFCIGAPTLDLVMPYNEPGGNFLAKFHPATWIAGLLAPFLFMSPVCSSTDRHYRRVALLFFSICLFLALQGKGALMSSFVDIHLVPAILLVALSTFPFDRARTAPILFVWICALNVFIVAAEYALHKSLLPVERQEVFFRPMGLFGHPISAGMEFCCAMVLLARGGLFAGAIRPLMFTFLMGTILCGVRGPLAIAALIFFANIIWPAKPRRWVRDYMLDFGILILAPVGATLAYSAGAFDRILSLGLSDDSSQSRTLIFQALDWLTDTEFWWGIASYDKMEYFTKSATGGNYIENSFVFTTFSAGFPVAVSTALALLFLHSPAIRRSLLFGFIVLMAATSTIGFSTKGSQAAAIALTGYWIWRCDQERRRYVPKS